MISYGAPVSTKALIVLKSVLAKDGNYSTLLAQVIDMTEGQIALIAGGGKYGSGALKYFLKQPDWKVVICDEDSHCQASTLVKTKVELAELGSHIQIRDPTLLIADAVEAAVRFLTDGIVPKMILPCVPFHFAAKVLTGYMVSKGLHIQPTFEPLRHAFEKAQLEGVEYKLNQKNALAVASKMPFNLQCAPGCQQPRVCPVTGRRLSKPMYQLVNETLNEAKVDIVKVLRSRLIAPNIGGFSGEELKQILNLCVESVPCTIAIATSCDCHAVANVFRIEG